MNRLALMAALTFVAAQTAYANICGRTPEIARAIANRLSKSCDQVTNQDLQGLSDLRLSYQNISSLRVGDFKGLDYLEYLDLTSNQITSIPAGVFSDLKQLKGLYLYINNIKSIDPKAFEGLSLLEELNLSYNGFGSVSAHAFDDLVSLQYLNLSYLPQLTAINLQIFANKPLQEVYMRDCRLSATDKEKVKALLGSKIDFGN